MESEDSENVFLERKTSVEVKLFDEKESKTNHTDTSSNYSSNSTNLNNLCSSFHEGRHRLSNFLQHNHKFHIFVTALVAFDVAIIIVQLILEASSKPVLECPSTAAGNANNTYINTTATTPAPQPTRKSTLVEDVEHVIHYISIGVLSIFMLEICLKLFAFGPITFFSHKLEVMDALVVSVAFFLDLFIHKEAVDDAVSLLVLVRLWRVLHIVSGIVYEVKCKAALKEEKLKIEIALLEKEVERLKSGNVVESNGKDAS